MGATNMERYIKFAIYSNIPSLLLIIVPAISGLLTGGNWQALMAFYNFVLYIIPVTIILIYLIRSLVKGLNPHRAYMVLYFALSTICMVLLAIAWSVFTPIVVLVSCAISYAVVRVYKRRQARRP